jgi:hypothetical protein
MAKVESANLRGQTRTLAAPGADGTASVVMGIEVAGSTS